MEHIIEWDAGEVGGAYGHIEIVEMHLSLAEIEDLIADLKQTRDEMRWHDATWLAASAVDLNKTHLFRKDAYEQDKCCKALCGRLPQRDWSQHWDGVTPVTSPGAWSCCGTCRTIWEKQQANTT